MAGTDATETITKARARAIIERIPIQHGIYSEKFKQDVSDGIDEEKKVMMEGTENIKRMLAKTVENLSDNLYNSRSRFVLECIQNADDNEFSDGQKRFLRFTVEPDSITLESDEKGFSEADVKAICSVCESTKAVPSGGSDAATGAENGKTTIGEKGVGFKSVFKIASRAHIRSGAFTFMFDKTKELGMITPEWDEEFFSSRKASPDAQTEIVLTHPPLNGTVRDYAEDLGRDFQELRPEFLMFLRRLNELRLKISATSNHPRIDKTFSLITLNSHHVQIREVATAGADRPCLSDYYRFSFKVPDLPNDEKRPNMTTTPITLAFPVERVGEDWVPSLEQQLTFAFLPLKTFGFKFIIQADFVTTSDRQGIDEDRLWNCHIRDAFAQAFAQAIKTLLDFSCGKDPICYTWLRYLSDEATSKTSPKTEFWRILDDRIIKRLKSNPIILSRIGDRLTPPTMFLMRWAHDREMAPLLGSAGDYVSEKYQIEDEEQLLKLGVQKPSPKWFMQELQKLSKDNALCSKSDAWHEDIAKVINDRIGNDCTYDLRQLPLLPLEGRQITWVRAPGPTEDGIFFPESIGTNIPVDINLRLVEKSASKNDDRRKLFERLGVKNCDAQDVVNAIADTHWKVNVTNPPSNWTAAVLVSHAMYIYHARKHSIKLRVPSNELFIYLANEDGRPMRGRFLYLDRSRVPEALYNGSTAGGSFQFLHPLYLQSIPPEEHREFISWLVEVADVATILRMQQRSDRKLHPDFRTFMDSCPNEVLNFLRLNWPDYKKSLSLDVCDKIRDHQVLVAPVPGGPEFRVSLETTFAPEPELVRLSRELTEGDCCFLKLPGYKYQDWSFLKTFGLRFEEGVGFYAWILCQTEFFEDCSIERAKNFFKRVQDQCKGTNTSEIRELCLDNNMIWVEPSREGDESRYSTNELVWNAPPGFTKKPCLKPIYGQELEHVFCKILGVRNASIDDVTYDFIMHGKKGCSSIEAATPVYEYLQALCVASPENTQKCRKEFKSYSLVATASSNGVFEWEKSSECVWRNACGSTDLKLKSKKALSGDYSATLTFFFTNVLQIRDAGLEEFLADLRLLQKAESADEESVESFYKLIQSSASENYDIVRKRFNEFDSIFIPGEVFEGNLSGKASHWYPLSKCVWKAPKCLKSRIPLSDYYPHLRELFCTALNVTDATPSIVIDELLEITKSDPSTERNATRHSKSLLSQLAAYTQSGVAPESKYLSLLTTKACWPCLSNGNPCFRSLSQAHANDRQVVYDTFSDRVVMLDFSFEQTRSLMPLLKVLNFGRYLSKAKVETGLSEEGNRDEVLTDDLRQRTYALYQCVSYFDKQKTAEELEDLRKLLDTIEVYQSSAITQTYTLDGFQTTKDTGGLYIQQVDYLKLYVSTNQAQQKYAQLTLLPTEMITKVLKIPLEKSYQTVSSILNLPVGYLQWILVEQGIVSGHKASIATLPEELSDGLPTFSYPQSAETLSNSAARGNSTGEILQSFKQKGIIQDRKPDGSEISSEDFQASTISSSGAVTTNSASSVSTSAGKNLQVNHSFATYSEDPTSRHFGNDGGPSTLEMPPAANNLQTARTTRKLPDRSEIPFLAEDNVQKWIAGIENEAQSNGGSRFQVTFAAKGAASSSDSREQNESFDVSELKSSLLEATGERVGSGHQQKQIHFRHSIFSTPRSEAKRAENLGLGCLGELFVVNMLENEYKLPNFTQEANWTSSLREYANLRETKDDVSDIIYDDTTGAFTRLLLREHDELDTSPPEWLRQQASSNSAPWPKYFLEVKTTQGRLETPLCISNAQYRNAKQRTFIPNREMNEVYIIVRVYDFPDLDKCDMKGAKARMYVDPYAMYQNGALNFEAKDGYYVLPGERHWL